MDRSTTREIIHSARDPGRKKIALARAAKAGGHGLDAPVARRSMNQCLATLALGNLGVGLRPDVVLVKGLGLGNGNGSSNRQLASKQKQQKKQPTTSTAQASCLASHHAATHHALRLVRPLCMCAVRVLRCLHVSSSGFGKHTHSHLGPAKQAAFLLLLQPHRTLLIAVKKPKPDTHNTTAQAHTARRGCTAAPCNVPSPSLRA